MKMLWFDTETTGLDPVNNDIIQMAGIVVIDKKVVDSFDFKCAPDPGLCDWVSEEALKVHGYTKEQMAKWPDRFETFDSLIKILGKHIDKYNKVDKFMMAGHNPSFDKAFLDKMAEKRGFKYMHAYISYHTFDTQSLVTLARLTGRMPEGSSKLVDLCKYFGIPLEAHNAFNDITATRQLAGKLIKLLGLG